MYDDESVHIGENSGKQTIKIDRSKKLILKWAEL